MSFNAKVIIVSLLVLVSLPSAVVLYYKKNTIKKEPIKAKEEVTLTFIPGWNLSQVANYLVDKNMVSSTADFYKFTGYPISVKKGAIRNLAEVDGLKILADKPDKATFEGYLGPETFRVYKDAKPEEVVAKLVDQRDKQITDEMMQAVTESGKSLYEILTMASVVEKEARTPEDMAMVADIFWRRLDKKWALQSCATVNYITGKNDPGVSVEDTKIDSLYNTYKYPGLPPGPICNPSVAAIRAAIYPTKNDYWYFLTGNDGVMRYSKTLDEHNANKYKYLK